MLTDGFKKADNDNEDPEAMADHYKNFLASGSDEDDAEEKNIDDYRKTLLSGLQEDISKNRRGAQDSEDEVDFDDLNSDELNSEDLDKLERGEKINVDKKKKKLGTDIIMDRDLGQDIGKKLLKEKKEKEKKAGMSEFEKYQLKKRD